MSTGYRVAVAGATGAVGGEFPRPLRHALELFPRNISLLKQAAGIATGSNLNPTVMAA